MMYFSCKEGKAVNVYDFDNTIYDGESGFDIFMFYLKKDPKEIAKLIPRFGEAFIRYKRGAIKPTRLSNNTAICSPTTA